MAAPFSKVFVISSFSALEYKVDVSMLSIAEIGYKSVTYSAQPMRLSFLFVALHKPLGFIHKSQNTFKRFFIYGSEGSCILFKEDIHTLHSDL